MSEMSDRIDVVTDLLLGAAHSDGALEGREEASVRKLLGDLLGDAKLPAEVEARIKAFDPKAFDLKKTAASFARDDAKKKRRLLELVVAVGDADDVLDSAEDDYLTSLAGALGMQRSEYADLTLEIEELRDALRDVRKPPPVPASASMPPKSVPPKK